jgi:hypothetical protein
MYFTIEGVAADQGGLQLTSVPEFSFPKAKIGAKTISVSSAGVIKVLDYRGSSSGYTVLAQATPLVREDDPTDVLAMKSFKLSLSDKQTSTIVSKSWVRGLKNVEISDKPNKICYGEADTNGLSESGTVSAVLELDTSHPPKKAGKYNGVITYTLQDAL